MVRKSQKIDVETVLKQIESRNDLAFSDQPRRLSARAGDVLEQTIAIFNDRPPSRCSIHQLAAAVGMSTGNFNYHFRTAVDLYKALFDLMSRELAEILNQPAGVPTVGGIVKNQTDIHLCLWRHRYFFRDLDYIVNSSRALFANFTHLQEWTIAKIVERHAIYRKYFVRFSLNDPSSEVETAQNCWMVWLSWLRWEAMVTTGIELAPLDLDRVIYRLCWHHFGFYAPYMDEDAMSVIATELRSQFRRGVQGDF